jgi:outer membrane receptor protein involved in Fe transport
MILHPYINTFAACESNKLCGSNNPDTADSSGNPNLQPERAVGLNLSYTHGLGESSELALEIYTRAIDRKIGSELFLENVAWSSTQRYVIRPSNLGNAKIRGLNLSMRFSANDIWKAAPKLDVSGNIGFAHSELSSLPGPDNRLAGQTPWQAKLGIGYTSKDYPLKVNLDADWLPADWVRDNLSQRSYQSHKFNLNANTNWNINSDLSVSLIFTNLAAKNSQRIEEYQTTKAMLQQHTNNSSYRRIALRLNIKL